MTYKIKKEKLMKPLQWVILPLIFGLLIAGCSTEPKPEHYGLYAVVAGGKLVELKKTDELPSGVGTTDPILDFILYSDELKHGDFRLYQYNIKVMEEPERVEFKVVPVKGERYMHKLVPTIELQRGYYLMRREEDARGEGWDLMYEPAGQRELKLVLVEFYMMMPERTRRYKSERINALVAEAVRGTNNREILNKAASFIRLNPYKTIQLTQTDSRGNGYPRFSPDGSQLVFVSDRDGNDEIYLVNADGTNLTRLTNNKVDDSFPAFSPDGSKIVFVSERERYAAIYTMNIDGSNQTRLTKHRMNDNFPAFSPDGKRILFRAGRSRYGGETYLVNADGTNLTQLKGDNFQFSPDGGKIVFVSQQDGNQEIYLMNAAGGKPTRLTNNKADDFSPAFSPDGIQLAFVSSRDGNREIYLMNADGSNQTRLTNDKANASPAFSPDGKQIVFVSGRDGNAEIYTMNVDGSNQKRLTNNEVTDDSPAFSPDGKRILFVSRGYEGYFMIMNADGTNQTRLHVEGFRFSPDGTLLAFVSERDGNAEIYLMELDVPISSNDILAFVEKKE